MTPDQREAEERIIKSMYHKLSFLRNPRYPMPAATAAMLAQGMRGGSSLRMQQQHTSSSSSGRASSRGKSRSRSPTRSGRSPVPHTTAAATAAGCVLAEDAGFQVSPAAGVLFDAYEPGGVYFAAVQLQNVGGVMRGLRLLPPASRYFQVSLPRFPGADPTGAGANELAPGMCAEVSVCFTPDTLGDYADAFAVQTQLGRFEVALRGSRPHPRLSLPDELQAGDVLVGNSRSRTVNFTNTVRQLRVVGRGSDVTVQLVEIDGRQLQQEDAQAPVWFGQVSNEW
ncbi:hypothetical protein OEZ85_002609 [Tetradesmus obliquus]|uniref:Deleted in lung and esophageal cancer protein 1 Ig-like domain-containing protein n=1 Tax=Tetradesmus obliquus TaxID=3088 RepID=A0ABY8TY14_TETOB|nr:hypothetical protein OEZ85_002609 [Tetradesmus obliquus]